MERQEEQEDQQYQDTIIFIYVKTLDYTELQILENAFVRRYKTDIAKRMTFSSPDKPDEWLFLWSVCFDDSEYTLKLYLEEPFLNAFIRQKYISSWVICSQYSEQ